MATNMINLKGGAMRRRNKVCLWVTFVVVRCTRYKLQTRPGPKQASDFRRAIGRHTGNAWPIDRATARQRCDHNYAKNQSSDHKI